MKLFEEFVLRFEHPDWSRNAEFGLLDAILESCPSLVTLVSQDVLRGSKQSDFGRQDMPSVEQIVRAAIYKELKGLNYRELEYDQTDSRICAQFVKIDILRPYSFQLYQKYISKITEDNLQKLLVALNKIAIQAGLEDVSKLRQDTTVVASTIHYPTNNSLVWDCIKESTRLLTALSKEMEGFSYRDYTVSGKKTFFKINNTRSGDKRVDLFKKQLVVFTKCINQISNVVKKKPGSSVVSIGVLVCMENLLPVMQQVFSMTKRKEIKGEKVPNDQKIFSIYEKHTDIIVKGSRDIQFGHKVSLGTGKSNLILNCEILKGNPSDSGLFGATIDKVVADYGIVPRDSAADGGYASKANSEHALAVGIKNIVFNKITGSLKNVASSQNIETRLKKWRSGIEANISNFKRGFNIRCCTWKGEAHFKAKVLWSAIAYNVRVMTSKLILQL